MKVRLTLDIFSGRSNPTLELSGSQADALLKNIQLESGFSTLTDGTTPEPFNLGFRGVIVEQLENAQTDFPARFRITPDRLYAGDQSAPARDTNFEQTIFDRLTNFKQVGNKRSFEKFLNGEINRFRLEREKITSLPIELVEPIKILTACSCAPASDTAYWNDGGQRQSGNNCYNYSTNYRTDTFAQPGQATGQRYTLPISGCTVGAGQRSVKDGAVSDGLIDMPTADNKCPSTGHLVALVIAPNYDYHWYRKGPNGRWSHKPGGTQATLLDNAGNAITDPRTAARGPYTQFCTFMQVIHGHFKIR